MPKHDTCVCEDCLNELRNSGKKLIAKPISFDDCDEYCLSCDICGGDESILYWVGGDEVWS